MAQLDTRIEFKLNGTWTDVTRDLVLPLNWNRGIKGNKPKDRTANSGLARFKLRNGENSLNGLGSYSPNHPNVTNGFKLGTPFRIIQDDGVNTPMFKYRGIVSSSVPLPGRGKARTVKIEAQDIIAVLARQKMERLSVQTGKRTDQLITTIVAALTNAPLATSYAVGPDTYDFALHNDRDERTALLAAIHKAVLSGLGFFFAKGDTTGGETLSYQSRHTRLTQATIDATFSETMQGLEIEHAIKNIFNRVVVVSHPSQVDSNASGQSVYALQAEFNIPSGQEFIFNARYRDPDNPAQRISGTGIVKPLEANTDFKASSVSDDGGNDLNGDMTITVDDGANSAQVSITNGSAVTAYINKLEIRGKRIRHFEPVEAESSDSGSKGLYQERPLFYDRPNSGDPNTGNDFSGFLLSVFKDPATFVQSLTMIGQTNPEFASYALALEPGSRIKLSEGVTGLSDKQYFINGYSASVIRGGICKYKYTLTDATAGAFWFLGTVGASELGSTTILGF